MYYNILKYIIMYYNVLLYIIIYYYFLLSKGNQNEVHMIFFPHKNIHFLSLELLDLFSFLLKVANVSDDLLKLSLIPFQELSQLYCHHKSSMKLKLDKICSYIPFSCAYTFEFTNFLLI